MVENYYFKGDGPNIVPATDVHDLVAFFERKGEALSPHDALVAGLEKAVGFWKMGTIDVQQIKTWEAKGKNLFYYGPDAYWQWHADLAGAGELAKGAVGQLRQHNMWVGCSLNDARKAAAKALPELAKVLRQEGARKEALAAGELYGKLAALSERKLVPGLVTDEARFTPDVRKAVSEALDEMEQLDTEAMEHVERAVKAETGAAEKQK